MMKQIKIEKLFLKEELFAPLDLKRFTCELVVQLKNITQLHLYFNELPPSVGDRNDKHKIEKYTIVKGQKNETY